MIIVVDPDILNACIEEKHDISGEFSKTRVFTSILFARLTTPSRDNFQFGIDAGGNILLLAYRELFEKIEQDDTLVDWRSSDVYHFAKFLQEVAITEPDEEKESCICLQIPADKKIIDLLYSWKCTEITEETMLKMAWDGVMSKKKNVNLVFLPPMNKNNNNHCIYNAKVRNQVTKQVECRDNPNNKVVSKVVIKFANDVTIGLPFDEGTLLTNAWSENFEYKVGSAIKSKFTSVNFSLEPPIDPKFQCDFYGEEDNGLEKVVWVGECKLHLEGDELPLGTDAIQQLNVRKREIADFYKRNHKPVPKFRLIVASNAPEPGSDFWKKASVENIEFLLITLNSGWKTHGKINIQHIYDPRKS